MLKTWRWVASALISATVLAIIPASAKADGTQHFTDINNTFYSQKIINDCFYQAQPAEFKKEFTSQPWLWMTKDSNTGVAIGRYISPGGSNLDGSTNGWIKCNNEGVMNQATRSFLEYAKYADIDAFVKELGYTVITKQECARMSTGTYPTCVENRNVEFYSLNGKKANMAAIQSKTPPQSSPALYFALNTIFTRECVATSGMQITRKVIVEDPPGSQKYISQDASVTIKSISPGGYNNGGVTYGSTATPLTAYDYSNQNTNCKDLSAKIDGLTGATLAFNSQNPDLAITTSATATTSPIKTGAGEPTEAAPTCTVEAVGWIICPVTNFLAKIVDGAYGLVDKLLVFNGFTSAENSSMRSAWEGMRNIANIFFVIGFLIIVFSQITSIGISNYGIKKLLPKLIVTAILVNLSYTLCAIAVDASNLLGSSIKDLFTGFTFDTKPQSIAATGEGWAGIAGGILAGTVAVGAALYVGLSALLPALIAAIVSIVTAFLVLTLRQALIILLVVISPLAIVAMLLPNTENWFKKWKSTFTTMLLIYPIIGLLFGASALASKIITSSATGDAKLFIQIMGALVAILPLALTPILLKASGGILGKFGAMVNNPNKGPFDRMRKGAERVRKDAEGRRSIRALTPGGRRVFGAGRFRRQSKREAVSAGIEREQANAQKGYIARQIDGNAGFANRVAGGGRGPLSQASDAATTRAQASARLSLEKATAENIEAESITVRDLQVADLKTIITSSNASEERKSAAMQRLVTITDPQEYVNEVNDALSGGSETLRRATAEALGKNTELLKASDIDKYATGTHYTEDPATGARTFNTLGQTVASNTASGFISQEKMVKTTTGQLEFAWNESSDDGKRELEDTARALLSNEQLVGSIKHNKASINTLAGTATP